MSKESLFSGLNPPTESVSIRPKPVAVPKVSAAAWALVAVLVIGLVGFGFNRMKLFIAPILEMAGIHMATEPGYTKLSASQDKDSLTVQMRTDNSHNDQLCDQVMELIYDLAVKNPSANQLNLVVQVDGSPQVDIQTDLELIRKYFDKAAYVNSEHRAFVGGRLLANGLISEASLAASPLSGPPRIIGNTYQSTQNISPRFGVYFIDDTNVNILADGVQAGSTRQYSIQGDTIVIPSSCTTFHLKFQGNDLVETDLNCTLSQTGP